MTKVQKKQNSLIINYCASLIELKELFSTTQAENVKKFESITKWQAEMLELYNSAQTEKVKRFNSMEIGQAEIMNLLSTLIENTKSVQEGATKSLGSAEDLQGGATNVHIDVTPPPTLEKNNKFEISKIENDNNASFPPTGAETNTMIKMGTHPTAVPNSSFNNIKTEEESQSNLIIPNSDTTKLSPLNLSGPNFENPCNKNPAMTICEIEAKSEEKVEAQNKEKVEAQLEGKIEVKIKMENPPRARRSKLRRKMRYKNHSTPSPNFSPQPPRKPAKSSNWISNISAMFSNIMGNSPNVLWGILLLFAIQMTQSHAATIQPSPSQTVLASLQPSPHHSVYPLLEMETKTWAYNMGEVEDAAYSILDDACYYLAIADDQCTDHPSSCQATLLSSENFKKSM